MSHTPEPWEVVNREAGRVIRHAVSDRVGIVVAMGQSDADARRIVACVNACEGILTETLEGAPKAISKYIQQGAEPSDRDTYRDLCAEMLEAMLEINSLGGSPRICRISNEQIFKAKKILGENNAT